MAYRSFSRAAQRLFSTRPPARNTFNLTENPGELALGHLIDESDPAIASTSLSREEALASSDAPRGSRARLDPKTLRGKVFANTHLNLPREIQQEVSKITWQYDPQYLRQKASKIYQLVGDSNEGGLSPASDELDADSQILALFLQNYASAHAVLSEARRRTPGFAPKNVLDVSFGPATGIVALNEVMDNSWRPESKTAVVIGHSHMRLRAKEILAAQGVENDTGCKTAVVNKIPHRREAYDLIIASQQLLQPNRSFAQGIDERVNQLIPLLSESGLLVLVERGDPRGFESLARAREYMLRPKAGDPDKSVHPKWFKVRRDLPASRHVEGIEKEILENYDIVEPPAETAQQRVALRVVAPCQHHNRCPLQVSQMEIRAQYRGGPETWCHFGQNIARPRYMQELKKGKYLAAKWDEKDEGKKKRAPELAGSGRPGGAGSETASFSYLIVQRTPDTAACQMESEDWGRVMRNPLVRHGHVTMEVCAPNGGIEQWTVPKSLGKQEYHDARKVSGGDLWALDVKSRQPRGGNRKMMRRFLRDGEKVVVKGERMAPANDYIANAWNEVPAHKQQPVRGYDPAPGEENDLFAYFKQQEEEYKSSMEYKKEEKRLRKQGAIFRDR